ncbi:MAG: hypothetical protein K940chlam1_00432 [Candidatus Anoxychlamydiales bacterium]|nr:hypothetical protein [Candidatus Anoxychlamydiales bacterium]NGX36286.1 hypothetical protein [Candidatus Anoxychlamydiales bacterium]
MGNNIYNIHELSSTLKEIKKHLIDENQLNKSDILTIADMLDEITETSMKIQEKSKNIFAKAGASNISNRVENMFSRMQEIEDSRHMDDEKILKTLHQMSFKIDYLELSFSNLAFDDIETILMQLDEQVESIDQTKPYDDRFILPMIKTIKQKLVDLHFRFDFPIVEELDENKSSYAHRLVLMASEMQKKDPKNAEFITNKIDDLMDLVWISKMFMYGDLKKAKNLFEKVDEKTKQKINQIIWKLQGERFDMIKEDNKWILPSALMSFVASEINA